MRVLYSPMARVTTADPDAIAFRRPMATARAQLEIAPLARIGTFIPGGVTLVPEMPRPSLRGAGAPIVRGGVHALMAWSREADLEVINRRRAMAAERALVNLPKCAGESQMGGLAYYKAWTAATPRPRGSFEVMPPLESPRMTRTWIGGGGA